MTRKSKSFDPAPYLEAVEDFAIAMLQDESYACAMMRMARVTLSKRERAEQAKRKKQYRKIALVLRALEDKMAREKVGHHYTPGKRKYLRRKIRKLRFEGHSDHAIRKILGIEYRAIQYLGKDSDDK